LEIPKTGAAFSQLLAPTLGACSARIVRAVTETQGCLTHRVKPAAVLFIGTPKGIPQACEDAKRVGKGRLK